MQNFHQVLLTRPLRLRPHKDPHQIKDRRKPKPRAWVAGADSGSWILSDPWLLCPSRQAFPGPLFHHGPSDRADPFLFHPGPCADRGLFHVGPSGRADPWLLLLRRPSGQTDPWLLFQQRRGPSEPGWPDPCHPGPAWHCLLFHPDPWVLSHQRRPSEAGSAGHCLPFHPGHLATLRANLSSFAIVLTLAVVVMTLASLPILAWRVVRLTLMLPLPA